MEQHVDKTQRRNTEGLPMEGNTYGFAIGAARGSPIATPLTIRPG